MTRPVADRPDFGLDVEPGEHRTTLRVAGEVDLATADGLAEVLREHLAAGPVLLDLRAVTFLDSSGVRMLDTILRAIDDAGWDLRLRPDLRPNVRRVLELTGILGMLPWDGPAPS